MAKFIVRRILLLLLTMFLVSLAVFLITESSPGNVARNVLIDKELLDQVEPHLTVAPARRPVALELGARRRPSLPRPSRASSVDEVERLVQIKPGETSEDMRFSLETVNCVGACAMAPVFIVNETYHGKAKTARIARILKRVAAGGQDSAD